MPLRGNGHSKLVGDDAPYFESLSELDDWAVTPSKKLDGVLPYTKRSEGLSSDQQGKLLVCHDYKGGYTECPSALSYTFNFWSHCDIFVYFSHHRVTIPPSGWTTAAHRQGVKMLGTLIFEGSSENDCLRLLVGQLPQSVTGPVLPSSNVKLPLSPHYARLLADLALQRGFDGYLLNFECPLVGGIEQTQALAAWITLLQVALKSKIGAHAQTIWYDSVIFTGELRWQDRLNSLNLPFFLASTALFTNYTWPPQYPLLTAQYFSSLDPTIVGDDGTDHFPAIKPKTLHDIFTGVDVWGRGSHGGGGFGCYKAIDHIAKNLGSVAIFGQAWSWESQQDKPGWTWENWWKFDRALWLGPERAADDVYVPDAPKKGCHHGKFEPLVSFFRQNAPPNPAVLSFYTSFGVGVGRCWFVEGVKVLKTENGWTDIDKQCSFGNLVWPRPNLAWEDDDRMEKLPDVSSMLDFEDAWNGGNSLRLGLSSPGSDAEAESFRCVWLPIQSLAVTPRKSYDARIVYKANHKAEIDLDVGLSLKLLSTNDQHMVQVNPISDSCDNAANGWTVLSIQFEIPAATDHSNDVPVAIGLIIGFTTEDPTGNYQISLLLGQMSVFPTTPLATSSHQPKVLWANFESPSSDGNAKLHGTITWEVATSFAPLTNINITSPEDPSPVWILDISDKWFPTFLYFNIYIQPRVRNANVPAPGNMIFIGTTGLDGKTNRFFVDPECLPDEFAGAQSARFLVQGVTDRGDLLGWDRCAFVDVGE